MYHYFYIVQPLFNISCILLEIILTFFAVSAIFAENPVYAILFLAIVALILTGFFLVLGLEFIGLMFGIVYIGAIIILFLFVVMLLNLDEFFSFSFTSMDLFTFCLLLLVFTEIFTTVFIPTVYEIGVSTGLQTKIFCTGQFFVVKNLLFVSVVNSASALGFLLFETYTLYVLLAGLLLLLILMGVVLMLRVRTERLTFFSKLSSQRYNVLSPFFLTPSQRFKKMS